jgi:hypothetical protein
MVLGHRDIFMIKICYHHYHELKSKREAHQYKEPRMQYIYSLSELYGFPVTIQGHSNLTVPLVPFSIICHHSRLTH